MAFRTEDVADLAQERRGDPIEEDLVFACRLVDERPPFGHRPRRAIDHFLDAFPDI
jgi:hypothetical protein